MRAGRIANYGKMGRESVGGIGMAAAVGGRNMIEFT
jgi:hypothetical protein